MPWEEKSIMRQREEFVMLASREGANMRELCRRFQISHTTGYKWLGRHNEGGAVGLADQSRRPLHTPGRSAAEIEAQILAARQTHPKWGARKLKRWLEDRGAQGLPAASTVHAILQRHGQISPSDSEAHQPWRRFEHAAPNDLWQMDFKGHFPAGSGRCHALTVLDDHSRYVVCLGALGSEDFDSTQQRLIQTFRRYGLPWRMTMDNGSPWGEPGGYTRFELWLMRLGVRVSHSRPYHPQTQGKDERFHRTLKAEVLQGRAFRNLPHVQTAFDGWLSIYNRERPHEALGMQTPVTRYAASIRAYPEQLPALEYAQQDQVRKVQSKGEFSFMGKEFKLGRAFTGSPIGLRPTTQDETRQVYFGIHRVATINLKDESISIEKARLK
jgi:transposase InsO family protein